MVNEVCPICLENLYDKKHISLNCSHKFHYNCYCNWCLTCLLKNKKINCPICRKKVEPPWATWFLQFIWFCYQKQKKDILKILSPKAKYNLYIIMKA